MINLIKPPKLKKGDKVAIVSLSSGILGEPFCSHNIKIGKNRLENMGLIPVFMPNSLKGMQYIQEHPEKRAEDLKSAFLDKDIKAIICAIGGNDTYLTVPYLMDDPDFVNSVRSNPKIFTGFSDSTINHLMFYKLGLQSFYGPNFLCDFADIGNEMLEYTRNAFSSFYFAENQKHEITSSKLWFEERTDFSQNAIGQDRISHPETHGFELLQGSDTFEGNLWGGCIESICSLLDKDNRDIFEIGQKYHLIPTKEHFKGKILFLESSDNKIAPELLRKSLLSLKGIGIFDHINAIIVGKPQDEAYYKEYKSVFISVIDNPQLPILYNINFGHAYPRTVLAYGAFAKVHANHSKITLTL